MKQLLSAFTLTLLLFTCESRKAKFLGTYNRIADYRWAGQYNGNHYTLTLLRAEDIWFNGFLTKNVNDTFWLFGFVKGNHYITHNCSAPDFSQKVHDGIWYHDSVICSVDIWYHKDTVTFRDRDKIILDTTIVLYKIKR